MNYPIDILLIIVEGKNETENYSIYIILASSLYSGLKGSDPFNFGVL